MIFGPKTIRTVPVNFDEKLVITAGKTLLYSTGSLYPGDPEKGERSSLFRVRLPAKAAVPRSTRPAPL